MTMTVLNVVLRDFDPVGGVDDVAPVCDCQPPDALAAAGAFRFFDPKGMQRKHAKMRRTCIQKRRPVGESAMRCECNSQHSVKLKTSSKRIAGLSLQITKIAMIFTQTMAKEPTTSSLQTL